MKADYTETFFAHDGAMALGESKSITLPFSRVSARGIVVRRRDGALIGTLHRKGGRYALPGGTLDAGESPEVTLLRELEEENITLIGNDDGWRERIIVDYFHGYRELAVWYLFIVDDADIQPCDENIESRWVQQDEDVWYPYLREHILLSLQVLAPELSKRQVVVNG